MNPTGYSSSTTFVRYYSVTATIEKHVDGWRMTRDVPAFILDANTHGIRNTSDAAKVAERIINNLESGDFEVHSVVMPI